MIKAQFKTISFYHKNTMKKKINNLFKKIIIILNSIFIFAFYISSVNAAVPVFVDTKDISDETEQPGQLVFNNDGTKMFLTGYGVKKVFEYALSTAYDVSTASITTNYSVSAKETALNAVAFNPDGTKMFVTGSASDKIHQYSLSTGFDLSSTVTFVKSSDSITEEEGNPEVILFNDDGTKIYITGRVSDAVHEYDLGSAYDVGSLTLVTSFSMSSETNITEGMSFNDDGTKLFMNDLQFDKVFQYSLSTPYSFESTVTLEGSFSIADQESHSQYVAFNDDGTKMYIVGNNGDDITEYSLSCAFHVLTTSCSSSSSSSSTSDPTTNNDVVGSLKASTKLSKNVITHSINSISDRLNFIKNNKSNENLSYQKINLNFGNPILASMYNASSVSKKLNQSLLKNKLPEEWSMWNEGTISLSKILDDSTKKDILSNNLTIGFDKKINANKIEGFAFQVGYSDIDVGKDGTGSESINYNLSIYRTNPLENNNYIDTIFGIGLITNDLTRIDGTNILSANRNDKQLFGSFNLNKPIKQNKFTFTPSAKIDFGYTFLESFREQGTNALKFSSQEIETGIVSLGLKFDGLTNFNNSKIKPFGSLEYGYDFTEISTTKLNYISDTGTTYSYDQDDNLNHVLTSKLGFNYSFKDKLNIFSNYKRTQRSSSNHTDSIDLSLNFKSKRETEYAMSLGGSKDLSAGFNVAKNINGFDLKFDVNQSFEDTADKNVLVSLSTKF